MTLQTITPAQAQARIADGACLIDVRNADEYARQHIPGALNRPLDRLAGAAGAALAGPVVFHCRSGARTAAHAARLAAACSGQAYILDGGLDAWRKAGLPVVEDRRQPLELMRQVQIAAGLLVLMGVVLGILVSPVFLGVAGFVGAGLTVAGATGWCGMARLLAHMPWNRPGGQPQATA